MVKMLQKEIEAWNLKRLRNETCGYIYIYIHIYVTDIEEFEMVAFFILKIMLTRFMIDEEITWAGDKDKT